MIREAGGEAMFVKTDVSQESEVESLIKQVVDTYGRLDCAHNNAGIQDDFDYVTTCTAENWDRGMGISLKGVWLCLKYEIPQMKKQGGKGWWVKVNRTGGMPPRSAPKYPTATLSYT